MTLVSYIILALTINLPRKSTQKDSPNGLIKMVHSLNGKKCLVAPHRFRGFVNFPILTKD